MRRRTVLGLLATAVAVMLVAVVAASPAALGGRLGRLDPRGARHDTSHLMPSIVRVEATGTANGESWTATGYGVVVDPGGLILTNAHVAAPDAPGLAATYWDPFITAIADQIIVSVTPGADAPEERFTGIVLAADGWLDVAIVGLEATWPLGDPVTPGSLSLASLPLADTSAVGIGTPVTFATNADPGLNELIGATTGGYHEQAGTVTELVEFLRVTDAPALLQTDLFSPSQFSGGAAVDGTGALLGLPSWHPLSGQGASVGIINAALIAPLLDAAVNGMTYTTPYTVLGTGAESLPFSSWVPQSAIACADPPPTPVAEYPAGATEIAATFGYDGFTDGEDLFVIWFDPVLRQLVAADLFGWDGGTTGDCYALSVNTNDGQPLAEGSYAVSAFVGPTLAFAATAETAVGQPSQGTITVSGRIVDADTGQGIPGASFFVLDPGVDPQTWFNTPIDDQIAASAVTAEDGTYETAPPVVPGVYPFVVTAPGYFATGGDLDITQGGFLNDIQLVAAE